MPKRIDGTLIIDIVDSIEKILRYTENITFEAFYNDEKTKDAVVRNLEIIGEAARHLSQDFIDNHKDIEWKKIAAFRNRLIHEYFGVDYSTVWLIIQHNLIPLRDYAQKHLL
jgi:uncharacterized protein with HEPN domain